MIWYEVLVPAALCALLIRLDAKLIGPYWSFYEVVSGMGGAEADFWYTVSTIRWAIVRRFLYVVFLGAVVSIAVPTLSPGDATVLGVTTAALLLWPIVFHGLPAAVSFRDWQLYVIYGAVVAAFGASAAFGHLAVDFIRAQAGDDLAGYLRDSIMQWLVSLLIGLSGAAFFHGSLESLKRKRRARQATLEE